MPSPSPQVRIISQRKGSRFNDQWCCIADENHFWMQWRFAVLCRQLRDLQIPLDQAFQVLEVGCGQGVLRKQIEHVTSWVVDGVDLDQEALKNSPRLRGNLFFYDILEKRAEFKEKYDFLILFDILEHVERTKEFLEAVLYHIKPGGCCLINVPAIPWLMSRYDKAIGHIRRYDRKRLVSEFMDLNVDILDTRYWGLLLISPLVLRHFMISRQQFPQEIIRRGFQPPNNLLNSLLKNLMSIETSFIPRPCWGTSLMAVIQKKDK